MTDREIEQLKGENLIELRVKARNLGVKSVTTYNKSGLIEKIREAMLETNSSLKADSDNENFAGQEEQNEDTRRYNSNSGGERGQYRGQQDGQGQQKRVLYMTPPEMNDDNKAEGVLEILPDGFGFLRGSNYLSTENDTYVSPNQIRKFGLKTGDFITGVVKPENPNERFRGMMYIYKVNGDDISTGRSRTPFEQLLPIYADEKLVLETDREGISTRIIDLFAPIGKGQRGMIVAPPKVGKTILLKRVANSITKNYPDVTLIVLLIDERPEEVTDMERSVRGADVVSSTFDETSENHIKMAELVIEHAKRRVELGQDVIILMDSITRLARAYNIVEPSSGKVLSGGVDPSSLHKPKAFFGAARNVEGGGSLTIIATALINTGSRMDDLIFEEFKGTGNMEIVLSPELASRRVYPAIDFLKSSTRKEDLLLTEDEVKILWQTRRKLEDVSEPTIGVLNHLRKHESNEDYIAEMKKFIRD